MKKPNNNTIKLMQQKPENRRISRSHTIKLMQKENKNTINSFASHGPKEAAFARSKPQNTTGGEAASREGARAPYFGAAKMEASHKTNLYIFNQYRKNYAKLIPLNIKPFELGEVKYLPPVSKEWKNTIYAYNKHKLKNFPVYDLNVNSLIKSYFNSCFNYKFMENKYISRRHKRLSFNKIYTSNAEVKHTNSKVLITIYTYNREKISLLKKILFLLRGVKAWEKWLSKLRELRWGKKKTPAGKLRASSRKKNSKWGRPKMSYREWIKKLKRLEKQLKLRKYIEGVNDIFILRKKKPEKRQKKQERRRVKKVVIADKEIISSLLKQVRKPEQVKRLLKYLIKEANLKNISKLVISFESLVKTVSEDDKKLFSQLNSLVKKYLAQRSLKAESKKVKEGEGARPFALAARPQKSNFLHKLRIFVKSVFETLSKAKKDPLILKNKWFELYIKILKPLVIRDLVLFRRYKLKFNLNKYKFEEKLLYNLSSLIGIYYNKKVEFNIVNMKSIVLNSDLFTKILTLKLKNKKYNVIGMMKIILNRAALPRVNRILEKSFQTKNINFNLLENKYLNPNINYILNNTTWGGNGPSLPNGGLAAAGSAGGDRSAGGLRAIFAGGDLDNLLNKNLYNVSWPRARQSARVGVAGRSREGAFKNGGWLRKHGAASPGCEANNSYNEVYNIIFNSIKYKNMGGIRLEVNGRLTKRYRADRSQHKLRWKGGLKNIDSSYKRLSSVTKLGYLKPNVEYSIFTSKRRIGSFAVKGWISGK